MFSIIIHFIASLIVVILLIQNSILWDCEPGESWMENCALCRCYQNSKARCTDKPCNIDIAQCINPHMAWYQNDYRCHCLYDFKRPIVICVKLEYPKSMNNQICSPQYPVVFGECVYCKCNANNRTECAPSPTCRNEIEMCVPNEHKIFGCLNCTCTHTMMRKCTIIENCYARKPGKCPKEFKIYDIRCTLTFKQSCYYDGHCDGLKKCCFTDCKFECTNPIY